MTAAILVTRAGGQEHELVAALRGAGLEPVSVPTIEIAFTAPRGDLDAAASLLHTYSWVVATSPNGARAILAAAERIRTELGAPAWAAIGPSTRATLEREGIEVAFEPGRQTGRAMARELPISTGDWVLVVRGDKAGGGLADQLRERGAQVDDVIAYRTSEAPAGSIALLRDAARGPIAAVVLTSGSTVRGLLSLGRQTSIDVRAFPAVCIGPETADEAHRAGFRILAISPSTDPSAVSATAADALAGRPAAFR